jgi:hypothetical protein
VILDELGYLSFSQAGGALLFHPISKLYECTSIITTNLSFAEWSALPPPATLHQKPVLYALLIPPLNSSLSLPDFIVNLSRAIA